jgi:hypothetical protein
VFAPFRDKFLTGFAEKGIVFIPAARSGAFKRGKEDSFFVTVRKAGLIQLS